MKRLFLAAGVATLAIAAPASADPGKNGAKAERGERSTFREARQKQLKRSEARSERAGRNQEDRAEARRDNRADDRRKRGGERSEAVREKRQEARAERRDRDRSERRSDRVQDRQVERREARRQDARDRRQERMRDQRNERRAERRIDREVDRDRERRIERRAERRDDRRDRSPTLIRERNASYAPRRDRDWDDRRYTYRGIPAAFAGGCPPGLAKKSPRCIPPGQAKQMLGQRLPDIYGGQRMPSGLRDYYADGDDHYWRYGDGYAYRVDRGSDLIRSILPLIGAGLGVGQLFPSSSYGYGVPDYYQSFYRPSDDDYYRYANGYMYEIDRDSGLIEDIYPLLDHGYGVGQMLPASYGAYNLPYPYRSYYADDSDYAYRYAPGAIYQVDAKTQLITAIVSLLTGGNGLAVGQQLPAGYDAYNLPYDYRDRYADTSDNMYRYSDGYIYEVDPTTRLITQVIDAIA